MNVPNIKLADLRKSRRVDLVFCGCEDSATGGGTKVVCLGSKQMFLADQLT